MNRHNTNMLSLFIVALFGMTLSAKGAPMFNTSFANFDGMVKREPWKPNPGVPPQPVDWQKILTVNDLYAVVGNQAVLHMGPPAKGSAIFASPLGVSKADHSSVSTTGPVQPGLEVLQFFPLAVSQGEFHQMSAMPAILSFQDASGGTLAAENEVARRVWRPDVQTDYFRVGDSVLKQEIATHDDVFVLRIKAVEGKLPPKFTLRGKFGDTAGALDVEQPGTSTFVWGQEQIHSNTCFALWSGRTLQATKISKPGQALDYVLEGSSGEEIVLTFGYGYQMADLQEKMKAAASDPAGIFAEATRYWNVFFTQLVPYFHCDDPAYVRQYYFTFYNVFVNSVDIPYEPFAFPYSVTSKLIWKDQNQPWNSGNDVLIMSWLNEKSLAEGNVLGPLRRGTWTIGYGFPDLTKPGPTNVNKFAFFQNMSLYSFYWEAYLKTRNKDWLREVYPGLVKHYEGMCRGESQSFPPLNSHGLAGWGLDDWDGSSRWIRWQADTWVDSSSYLVSGLECLRRMALELGDAQAAESDGKRAGEIKKKIQELLWDDKSNLFLDANLAEGKFSPIHSSGSFIPLFAGVPTPEQASKLVNNLVDPKQFWTPYPIPGLSIDMPNFRADQVSVGDGPTISYSANWLPVQGLVDYGYTGVAAELIRRHIRMATLEGISSPVKFNPITGEGLNWLPAFKQNILLTTLHSSIVDLIIRYVVGFRPRQDDLIEFRPIAEEKNWDCLQWGPFRYGQRTVSLDYRKDRGMTIECDGAKYTAPSLQPVVLKLEDGKLTPVEMAPTPEMVVTFPDITSSGRPEIRPSQRPPGAKACHWRFDGDADEKNESRYKGTMRDVVFGPGRFGQAANFNGTGARVDLGPTDLALGNLFTIAFWFKAGKADGADQVILAKGSGEEGGFKVYLGPNREIFFHALGMGRYPTGYTVSDGKWPSGCLVKDGEWHHFAMVRDLLDIQFYLDGKKICTHIAGGEMKDHTAPLSIGSSNDGGQPYGGSLDELYVLGWSLNPDGVKELMENKSPHVAQ